MVVFMQEMGADEQPKGPAFAINGSNMKAERVYDMDKALHWLEVDMYVAIVMKTYVEPPAGAKFVQLGGGRIWLVESGFLATHQ
jgi:hypothetical protein